MREIKFRAKSAFRDEWYYGFPIYEHDGSDNISIQGKDDWLTDGERDENSELLEVGE